MNLTRVAVLTLCLAASHVRAQTSAFTYQGQFNSNGIPATGQFDFRFTLHDTAILTNQVGGNVVIAPLGVTNGLFTTTLDFGAGVFDGSARWLQIGVRTNGDTNIYTLLAPRQLITSTPYAIRAANYSGPVLTANLSGKINDTNLSANVALLTNNAIFTRSVIASNFIGSGAFLTNLPATNLIGTIPDARLSTNIAFLSSNNVFRGSIAATNFIGYGGGLSNVPGFIFKIIPTAASVQSFANFGYLATNDTTPVVVTLPLTANINIGETIRVSASGAAGWIVAQNAGQVILVGNLLNTVGVSWRTNETSRNWKAIASSADGKKLVAVVNPGFIYTSTDYGSNWTQRGTSQAWTAVASSADGVKLVAAVSGGNIYNSGDSGASWIARDVNRSWTGVASSLDGTRMAATVTGGAGTILTSTDSGNSWTVHSPGIANWSSIASSADGLNLVATPQGNQIYTSSNAGINWTPHVPSASWTCVASSADGGVLVAGVNAGSLYVSGDFGTSWIPVGPTLNWTGVACSSDGTRMIAVANGGGVYVSMDSGLTWGLRGNLPGALIYNGAASSSDGSTLAAVANASGIFVSSKATTTVGATGQLIGSRLAAVELVHVGNGVFIPLSYAGTIRAK